MIKLKSLLNESSPGFENRQVGDALPTLDSVRTAYQAKKALEEAESFTAINKGSGKVTAFKSKDARDSAVKAGTHDKSKDSKDDKKDSKGGVNIFKKDSDSDSKKNLQKIKKDKSSSSNLDNAYDADDFQDSVDNLKGKISDEDYEEIKDNLEGLKNLQYDLEDIDRDEDNEEWGMQTDTIDVEVDDLKGLIKQAISKSSDSKDEPKSEPSTKFRSYTTEIR